jgi:hypothetical protein
MIFLLFFIVFWDLNAVCSLIYTALHFILLQMKSELFLEKHSFSFSTKSPCKIELDFFRI